MQQKVVVITTGGTIAMRRDEAMGGDVPAVGGAELLEAVPPLAGVCPVEVWEFANIPSPYMTPHTMCDVAHMVERALADDGVSGVVITHGTDTLEETAYFLDLYVDSPKPVCLTAAMRSTAELSADGPENILAAVRVAASSNARHKGVLVVMQDEIHAAREVTKTHSATANTFASPFWGPLGYVDLDRIIFRRDSIGLQKIRPQNLVDDVYLVTLGAGMDDFLLNCLISKGVSGIVVEGFGRGNVPPVVFRAMQRAVQSGIPVVVTTRCYGGRVLDVYAYEGGVLSQKEAGIILGGEISGQKARIKLMLALGVTRDRSALAAYFDTV